MSLVSAASVLHVALLASTARAQPESAHFELTLAAPAGCPSTAEIVAAVESLVHATRAEPLHVTAQISREAELFTLDASWENGQRRLQGDSCEGVSRALIAIVALAIDPSVELGSIGLDETESTESSAAAHTHTPQPASDPTRSDPLPARPRAAFKATPDASERARPETSSLLQLGGSLLALGEWGSLPSASYGITGLVRGSLQPWSAELGGAWLAPQLAPVAGDARKGGDISWRSLLANGCRVIRGPASACAGVEVGQLGGQASSNVLQRDRGTSLWLAAALTALARLPLSGGASLEVRAVAAFPAFRPNFSLEPYATLHEPYWVSGRLSLGIAYH